MHGETVRFDESSRSSHSDQPVGPGGVASALRQAAEAAGIDAPSELYNESIRFASEGHLGEARERLQTLLCLDPADGDAHLLLAKIHVAAQRWPESLASLDRARECGTSVPMTLRSAVEEHLRAEQAGADERQSALKARDDGEIQALRQEARRLRSENARLLGKAHDLGREVRRWAWGTTAVAAVSGLFILANLAFVGSSSTPAVATDAPVLSDTLPSDVAVVQASGVAAGGSAAASSAGMAASAPIAAPPAAPPTASSQAQQAFAALQQAPGLDGTALEVSVLAGKATLTGSVQTHRQRKRAADVLAAIPGVAEVDIDGVTVLARTQGASHTVVSGDSLSTIAYAYYGDSTKAKTILEANPKTLRGQPNLQIGMKLKLPAVQ
jgi:phage tail protein X